MTLWMRPLALLCALIFTVPALAQLDLWPADVPKVLNDTDVQEYRQMFRLQRQLQRPQVAAMVSGLDDRLLMGHLIAERLLHPYTRTPYKDLQRWLSYYHDHPQANDIHTLAEKRAPRSANHRDPSIGSRLSIARYSNGSRPKQTESAPNTKARQKLLRRLKYYRKKEQYDQSMSLLKQKSTKKTLGEYSWGQVCITLARSMVNTGNENRARIVAGWVVRDVPALAAEAHWLAGLAAYRQNDYNSAAESFRSVVYQAPAGSQTYTRAAYWAAKTYSLLGADSVAQSFLRMAVANRFDFYGQLAAAQLDQPSPVQLRRPRLDVEVLDKLYEDKGIRRVVALVQIGEYALAQQELKAAYPRVPYGADETLLALTERLHLPNAAMTLARNLKERNQVFLSGLYPLGIAWAPRGGEFELDPALIYGIMRQESAFDPYIESRAGARGLMQIMPDTASFIRNKQGQQKYPKHVLFNPARNLELAQWYLKHLDTKLSGNLVQMIAAYNAGPGNVNKWVEAKHIPTADPLLFIESIPFKETRGYVRKVLANTWVYQQRLNRPATSLLQLARNQWPVHVDYATIQRMNTSDQLAAR